MQNKRWTILFVCNEHAFVYMPNQFRYFYERNDPSSFEILIISNYDRDGDIKQLVKIYDDKYHNCRVLNFKVAENIEITEDNCTKHEEVDQHGESLNFGIKNVQTPYVVVQDPDFFWLQRDILEFFQSKIDEGYRFIGAPYPRKVGLGAPDFPTLYATVARSEDLKSVDLRGTYNDPELRKRLEELFPESEWSFSGDVGFRVRETFSKDKFLSFKIEQGEDLLLKLGGYSRGLPMRFRFEEKIVGAHLFGGCRDVNNSIFNTMLTDPQKADLDDYWTVQRERYSNYFLSLSDDTKPIAREKIWTVAFVNYKTSHYLKWQIKCLFDYNNPKEFDVIIVDNSVPSEVGELNQICSNYLKHGNIKIISFTPVDEAASGQHGEALSVALKYANSKYFLANDPDFFWLKKGHLKWLADLLADGVLLSIGSPYVGKVGNGSPNFPCAWGAAYRTEDIKHLDFSAISDPVKFMESASRYLGKEYSFDVGWKIRVALSNIWDGVTGRLYENKNYLSFELKRTANIKSLFGAHSYEVCTIKCFFESEVVAQHLFRGSFTSAPDGNKDLNLPLSKDLLKMRDSIGEYFYNIYSERRSFEEDVKLKMYFRLYLLIPLISFEKKYNCYVMYFLGIRSKFKMKTNKKPSMKACFPPKTIFELVINNLKLCEVIKGKHISLYVLNKRVF